MNRNDIKIDNQKIIAYCKDEHRMQMFVYEKRLAEGKMTTYQANRNFLIIQEFKSIAELLEKRGISWQEFKTRLKLVKADRGGTQSELF